MYTISEAILCDPAYRKGLIKLFKVKTRWIWHNGKFDIAFLRRDGIETARVDEDTMLLSYALDEMGGIHDLEQIAGELLDAPDYKHMVKQWVPTKKDSYRNIPKPILYEYQSYDVSNTLQAWELLHESVMQDDKLTKLYYEVLIPATEFLYTVEKHGMLVDKQWNKKQDKRLLKIIEKAKKVVQEHAGYAINPNSPQQLAELFFNELEFRRIRGNSTDKDVLRKLPDHPIVTAMKEYRKVKKQHSTYVVSVQKNMKPDGRIHCTYKIHGTRTGRLSSADPNMQNVPRDKQIRGQFIAPKGYILMEPDYSQAELRSLAQLSEDVELTQIYHDNTRSLHKEVALEQYGKGYNGDQYIRAKAVNFGIVYGREAPSFADEFNVSTRVGQSWIDGWFEQFPGAAKYIRLCRRAPINTETMFTTFGRKKRHWVVVRENLRDLMNEAANFPHQSIASDLTLTSGISIGISDRLRIPKRYRRKVAQAISKYGAYVVNIIHDSLLLEVPDNPETIKAVARIVVDIMQSMAPKWGINRVPFTVDLKIGKRWGYLKEVENLQAFLH